MNYVAEKMEDDWLKLIELFNNNTFQNNSSFVQQLKTNNKSGEENILEWFNETKLKWTELKQALLFLGKVNMVDNIEKNMLYTKGILIF